MYQSRAAAAGFRRFDVRCCLVVSKMCICRLAICACLFPLLNNSPGEGLIVPPKPWTPPTLLPPIPKPYHRHGMLMGRPSSLTSG